MNKRNIDELAKVLSKKIDKEIFEKKYAPAKEVLILVGAGVFIAGSLLLPGLPRALKPYFDNKRKNEYEAWKRFNIPYLKRTLARLEKEKLVNIEEKNGRQIITITEKGKQKILKFSIDELSINKPKIWDKKWRLISFDLPEKMAKQRKILVENLKNWGFYPIHKSVYLHAYPCFKEIRFLREYLGIGKFVKLFIVDEMENEDLLKSFFGV